MTKTIKAWDRLSIARMLERPNAEEYIKLIFDNFFELHGDRKYGDDKSIIGGIGFLDKIPVTIIGIQKGKNLKENMERNFGSPYPEGYRKSLRLIKEAEKFNRPVICFINTSGAYCGVEAEERGQGEAIATNIAKLLGNSEKLREMSINAKEVSKNLTLENYYFNFYKLIEK